MNTFLGVKYIPILHGAFIVYLKVRFNWTFCYFYLLYLATLTGKQSSSYLRTTTPVLQFRELYIRVLCMYVCMHACQT